MKFRTVFYIFLFILILILFGFLYFLGIMNLFMKESGFFERFKWLDLGKPIFSIFYLGILSIFFIVIVSIMSRIMISLKSDVDKPEKFYSELKSKYDKSAEEIAETDRDGAGLDENLFFDKMQETINIDNKIEEEANIRDRIDSIYGNIAEIISDIISATSVSDLFEKTLLCSTIATCSKKGSIMAVDKNKSLYVFKSTGWDSATERKLKNIKIPLGNKISGMVASKNARVFIKNIDESFELDIDYDFKYKNEYETRSFISLPIFGHNRVIAVLNLTDKSNGNYTKGELDILNIIVMLSSKIFELLQIKKKNKLINN
jgi:hypothetical protein